MNEDMFLVVGLGNPGSEYATTRHNVGFMVIDELARRLGVSIDREKWHALSVQLDRWGRRICLLKPVTFMNLSGQAVARYVDFYKVPSGQIVVVHDDIDMEPGRVKLVAGGGAGGHNGIRSLVQCLGTRDFLRLKLGVGKPGRLNIHAGIPVEKYVLAPFLPDERRILDERMGVIEKGLELLVRDGLVKAMNLLNGIKP
jgi:PTH1 family peptidyl-tRNA hydrolase